MTTHLEEQQQHLPELVFPESTSAAATSVAAAAVSNREQYNTTRLLPLQILEQYQAWHSVESLTRDYDPEDEQEQRFAVSYYSCPLEAGNRLYHFLNSFLWAILTNRTLLWDYWDRSNCYTYRGADDPGSCAFANTLQDCDLLLEGSSWMPSYNE
jgi:hypothetical protein